MIGDVPMRKFESRIHDPELIGAILDNIHIVHVGITDPEDDYPYVVPMNFGYEIEDGKLMVYLHCAREGHKVDLWTRNPKVSLTFSTFTNHPNHLYRGSMHDYRSVMANGVIRLVDHAKEAGLHGRAFQNILRHNGRGSNQFSVPHYKFMAVYLVECDWRNVTGKSEDPIKDVNEVPFPSMEAIGDSKELPYDYNHFIARKTYREKPGTSSAQVPAGLPRLPPGDGGIVCTSSSQLTLTFQWAADHDMDCDILALLLDGDGKVPRRYDVVFYNQPFDRSKAVLHQGDDILQTKGQERLTVDFGTLPGAFGEIVFLLAVYGAEEKQHHLGMIRQACVELSDHAMTKAWSLDAPWNGKFAAEALRLVKQGDGSWTAKGTSRTYTQWRSPELAKHYGLAAWRE